MCAHAHIDPGHRRAIRPELVAEGASIGNRRVVMHEFRVQPVPFHGFEPLVVQPIAKVPPRSAEKASGIESEFHRFADE